jgi:hypothetical protein
MRLKEARNYRKAKLLFYVALDVGQFTGLRFGTVTCSLAV